MAKETYKKELIRKIQSQVRKGGLPPIPHGCLQDMSTRSLVTFYEEWITPVVEKGSLSGRATVRMLPPPKGDQGE